MGFKLRHLLPRFSRKEAIPAVGLTFFSLAVYKVFDLCSQGEIKDPEFVPIYNEEGKLVGFTHPILVEHGGHTS